MLQLFNLQHKRKNHSDFDIRGTTLGEPNCKPKSNTQNPNRVISYILATNRFVIQSLHSFSDSATILNVKKMYYAAFFAFHVLG
jgi:hypothetical protein